MLLYVQFFLVTLIWILDVVVGLGKEFYLTVWWWDIPMHFLGGLWAGLFGLWFFKRLKKSAPISTAITVAICIGISWEIFEYSFAVARSVFMSYPIDTAKDLLMDTLGGITAGLLVRYFRI